MFKYTSKQFGDIEGFDTWQEAWASALTFAQENSVQVWVIGPAPYPTIRFNPKSLSKPTSKK